MLEELFVENFGLIRSATLDFGPGFMAITGETGAGKTMVVGALDLLLGGKADSGLIRDLGTNARLAARFHLAGDDGGELVLERSLLSSGRSRGYVNGAPATISQLSELGAAQVDIHGQNSQQSLLSPSVQRSFLDKFASITDEPSKATAREIASVVDGLDELGGDERLVTREIDLLRYQIAEIDGARLLDPDEDVVLRQLEHELSRATELRQELLGAAELTAGESGAADLLGRAVAQLPAEGTGATQRAELRTCTSQLVEIARELRRAAEEVEQNDSRLVETQARMTELQSLRKKYGDSLSEVIAFGLAARTRLDDLESVGQRRAELGEKLEELQAQLRRQNSILLAARQQAAPQLASAVQRHFDSLALGKAIFGVDVDGEAGERVSFTLAANRGLPPGPLERVASGGELARVMLALRLVVTSGPPTLLFDEVDSGVGGEAALAVGRALKLIARTHQVIVVTHLAQVAAFANRHFVVSKSHGDDSTVTSVAEVRGDDRVGEISRMLSGFGDSDAAKTHARELIAFGEELAP